MNTEWIYLALFGLMMAFCCYHMMHMMMSGSDASEHSGERVQAKSTRADTEEANAETADASSPKTS